MIPYGKQFLDQDDLDAVIGALRSPKITQGPRVDEFEVKLARKCGSRYAVSVSSGTAALHLATLALGLMKGDEILTTPISFLATSNAVLYVGAKPVFCDIEYPTANISVSNLEKLISRPRVKAIYPVHFGGLPCDMPAIHKIARKRGLFVVEDACHALGARYKYHGSWYKIGSCAHSDMAVFSFHPVKHITTGEGGAITTNSKKYYEKLLALRSHGMFRSPALSKRIGPWYYAMKHLGFNYRLTDIQAALGVSQLKKLDRFVNRRREIAEKYNQRFKGLPCVEIPATPDGFMNAYHLYPLRIDFKKAGLTRAVLMHELQKSGVGTQVHYIPIYTQPYYRELGYRIRCPEAERYYASTLSLPIYPSMTNRDVDKVVRVFIKTLRGNL
ncbi:MAG: UDP-4-amino-4,6-dideoxy-N-acetyl-beta-L-altrosamine transaminase [Candidatus Omnitrophota bacterium]|jgi:UDP-4-amino-4,6-dideoxy-N-acetyl-beta-L-altrosamine transaminase